MAQSKRIEARVLGPLWSATVLLLRVRLEGEGIEVGPGAGQLQARHRRHEGLQPECLNCRVPVKHAVVLGCRHKLQLLGSHVDHPVGSAAGIVAAGCGMIMIIRAQPALRVDQSLEHPAKLHLRSGGDIDHLFNMGIFHAMGNHHAVFAGRNRHPEPACLGMILVHATMGAVIGSEVGRLGATRAVELRLARDGNPCLILDIKGNGTGCRKLDGTRSAPRCKLHFLAAAPDITEREPAGLPAGQPEGKLPLFIGITLDRLAVYFSAHAGSGNPFPAGSAQLA